MLLTFFHPDYNCRLRTRQRVCYQTCCFHRIGRLCGSRAWQAQGLALPPVGNFTLPRRYRY
jgi:hypothetical protein